MPSDSPYYASDELSSASETTNSNYIRTTKFSINDGAFVDLNSPGSRDRTIYWGTVMEVFPESKRYKIMVGATAFVSPETRNVVVYRPYERAHKVKAIWHKCQMHAHNWIMAHEDQMKPLEDTPNDGDHSMIAINN